MIVLAYVLAVVFTMLTFFFVFISIGARNAMRLDESISPSAVTTSVAAAVLCFLTTLLLRVVIENGCL